MSTLSGRLIFHHRSESAVIATLDGFFVMRCLGPMTPDHIHATQTAHKAALALRPAGVASIVAVSPSVTFPSEATRRAAAEVSRATTGEVASHVLILLGDGFWASAIRGVMTTLTSLSSSTHPKNVVGSEEAGVRWTLETLGEPVHKYEKALLDAFQQMDSAK
jgi:hypothetical protein